MGDFGPGLGGDQRSQPGIGEEVQDLVGRPAPDQALQPRRGSPAREDADVTEGGETAEEADAVIVERPGLADRLLSASGRRSPFAGADEWASAAAHSLGRRGDHIACASGLTIRIRPVAFELPPSPVEELHSRASLVSSMTGARRARAPGVRDGRPLLRSCSI
jgi:hypothetical protein